MNDDELFTRVMFGFIFMVICAVISINCCAMISDICQRHYIDAQINALWIGLCFALAIFLYPFRRYK